VTIEELVNRLEARHRFLVSAFRAARGSPIKAEPAGDPDRAGFGSCRMSSRPPTWDVMMEMVGRLRAENVRWKEIREQVQTSHGYRFDTADALRKCFERWQKRRNASV
jgi:hypothetical protein